MKEFRMRAFFGILGLAGAGFMISSVSSVGGCSSSNDSTGTAGSSATGTAGSNGQGTAGTTGGGGSGGSGGGGGASTPAVGCMISDAPASLPAIADFSSSTIAIGGTFTYGPNTAATPTASVTGGAWNVTMTSAGDATMAQYSGAGIYFNGNTAGTDCVDGSAYTGIQFDISGTVTGTGCTVQFSINDSEHADSTKLNASGMPEDPKASGPSGSYAPQLTITPGATVATMMVPFTGTGAPSGGSPATGIDKEKLTGVQWQITTPAGATGCMVDLTIDNVKFY